MTMIKIDYKRELKHLYNPSTREVVIVDVPKMNFLMIDGAGDPNTSQEYREAVEALYALSYAVKFRVKKEKGVDYGVLPLESLWWTDDVTPFTVENKDRWKWTSMIMQPDHASKDLVSNAVEEVEKKKNPPALPKIRYERFHEGLSAQIMHVGPYSAENPTIEEIHSTIREKGYETQGKHHEIYLSDPRRCAPEKLKTVIRQPVK